MSNTDESDGADDDHDHDDNGDFDDDDDHWSENEVGVISLC